MEREISFCISLVCASRVCTIIENVKLIVSAIIKIIIIATRRKTFSAHLRDRRIIMKGNTSR